MVRFLPAGLLVLAVVAATTAPPSVSRGSVSLTFAGHGSPDGNNVSGARVDYIVKGDVPTAGHTDDTVAARVSVDESAAVPSTNPTRDVRTPMSNAKTAPTA